MDMEFDVPDRLALLTAIIPNIATTRANQRVVDDFEHDIGFTDEELRALSFKQTDRGTVWKRDAVAPRKFAVGETVFRLMRDTFAQMSDAGKLPRTFVTLHDRFVDGEWKE